MLLEFEYLADFPELIPLLSTWFFDQWGMNNPALTVEVIEEALQERLNRDKAPLCLVAFLKGEPVATAAIKLREMGTHPQFEHWLGNVYVLPEYRQQGIGTAINKKSLDEARRIGISELYLYTRNREGFYSKLGWEIVEWVYFRGRKAVIMKFELVQSWEDEINSGL